MTDTTHGSLRLTFAELEYLLARSSRWPGRRADLGLVEPESVADVAAAGLASLAVRGLVETDGDDVHAAAEAAGAALLIEAADRWIAMVVAHGNDVHPHRVGYAAADAAPVLVTPLGLGAFEVAALTGDRPLAEVLVVVGLHLLDEQGDGLVMFGQLGDDTAAGVSLSRKGTDRWSLGVVGQPTTLIDRAGLATAAGEALAAMLDTGRSR